MSFIKYLILFTICFSCKGNKLNNKNQSGIVLDSLKKSNKVIQNIDSKNINYSNEVLLKIKKFNQNKTVNGGRDYDTDSTKLFIEIIEDLDKNLNYTIRETNYTLNNHYNDNYFDFKLYKTFKDSILMVVQETNITKKDTFFFKNNKIYFWKNKQATKEELLKKEKEILAIKSEIDSIMEW